MEYRENSLAEVNIFSKVNELDLFRFYVLPTLQLGQKYHCPFRIDTTPSFNVFRARDGSNAYLWKDLGNGESGNIFKLIMKIVKYRNNIEINYYQAMCKVNQDHNLGLNELDLQVYDPNLIFVRGEKENESILTPTIEYEIRKIIYPKAVQWKKEHFAAFWNRFEHLTIDKLEYYNVYPASKVYLDRNLLWEWEYRNPIYSYSQVNDEWGEILYKIYRPREKNKRYKFLNSFTRTMIECIEQLPEKVDLLILTKSRKDCIILNLLGYWAVCLPSETAKFTQAHLDILKSIVSEIIILYDNDQAGITASNKINKEFGLKEMFYPKDLGKDTSEIYEKNKYNFTKRLLDNMINAIQRRSS